MLPHRLAAHRPEVRSQCRGQGCRQGHAPQSQADQQPIENHSRQGHQHGHRPPGDLLTRVVGPPGIPVPAGSKPIQEGNLGQDKRLDQDARGRPDTARECGRARASRRRAAPGPCRAGSAGTDRGKPPLRGRESAASSLSVPYRSCPGYGRLPRKRPPAQGPARAR